MCGGSTHQSPSEAAFTQEDQRAVPILLRLAHGALSQLLHLARRGSLSPWGYTAPLRESCAAQESPKGRHRPLPIYLFLPNHSLPMQVHADPARTPTPICPYESCCPPASTPWPPMLQQLPMPTPSPAPLPTTCTSLSLSWALCMLRGYMLRAQPPLCQVLSKHTLVAAATRCR